MLIQQVRSSFTITFIFRLGLDYWIQCRVLFFTRDIQWSKGESGCPRTRNYRIWEVVLYGKVSSFSRDLYSTYFGFPTQMPLPGPNIHLPTAVFWLLVVGHSSLSRELPSAEKSQPILPESFIIAPEDSLQQITASCFASRWDNSGCYSCCIPPYGIRLKVGYS